MKKNTRQRMRVGHRPAGSSLARNIITTAPDTLSLSSANSGFAPSHEEIAIQSEALWRQKGCPQGCDEEIWLEAEGELLRRRPLERDATDKMERADLGLKFDRISDSLMGELDERFPETTGKETTAL
ncbi:MAG: DUF2934 domain-containing protein [Opitutaceae bacterium]|jgi:hypothetical protein